MKNLFFAFALFCSSFSFADYWDNLTLEQAETVVSYLEDNPYIFAYCDCCEEPDVFLQKVTYTEIIPCSWDENFFSVRYFYQTIARVNLNEDKSSYKLVKMKPNEDNGIIYLNYTWAFNTFARMATPFLNAIDSSADPANFCADILPFPTPAEFSKVYKDKNYAKWYKIHHQ